MTLAAAKRYRGDRPTVGMMGVLAFIRSEVQAGRAFPQSREIAAHFGWVETSANEVLTRLAYHGHIEVADRVPSGRGWRYTYRLKGE